MHLLARLLGASLLAATMGAAPAAAATPLATPAPACHAPQPGLIARTDLTALFAAHPAGGAALEARLQDLLGRDPADARLLEAAAARSGEAQRLALGRAQARAALLEASCRDACRAPEPGLIRRTNLQGLLARHPDGGAALTAALTDLVLRDPADVAVIERAGASAAPAQRAAVEAALRAGARPGAGPCCPAPEPGAIARADLGRLLRDNPDGGAALTSAVERLLTRDPEGAAALVRAAASVGRDQRLALALGFLRALGATRDCPGDGSAAIRRALQSADPTFAAVLAALGRRDLAGPLGASFYPGAPGGLASTAGGQPPRLVSPH